jgi:hypothetical protein
MPNLIIENPKNGHAHYAYELTEPVTYFDRSHQTPISYLADIERGMVRRIDGDRAYGAFLAHNAAHGAWRVSRPRTVPYRLGDLAQWLEPSDMKGWTSGEREAGLGRNVTVFDELRKFAYGEVRGFKSAGAGAGEFRSRLWEYASELNRSSFASPLHRSEVVGIVRSVAKWTWAHFTPTKFREIQSKRGIRGMASRWAGRVPLDKSRPWEKEGCSRATWFRRQKAARSGP